LCGLPWHIVRVLATQVSVARTFLAWAVSILRSATLAMPYFCEAFCRCVGCGFSLGGEVLHLIVFLLVLCHVTALVSRSPVRRFVAKQDAFVCRSLYQRGEFLSLDVEFYRGL